MGQNTAALLLVVALWSCCGDAAPEKHNAPPPPPPAAPAAPAAAPVTGSKSHGLFMDGVPRGDGAALLRRELHLKPSRATAGAVRVGEKSIATLAPHDANRTGDRQGAAARRVADGKRADAATVAEARASSLAGEGDAFRTVSRTCVSIWGYDRCEHFQQAKCLAQNWTEWAKKRHALTMPNPTVTAVGGTRAEFFENLRALRKQHPTVYQLGLHRVSPLVLYGCATGGQRTEYVGDLDAFMSTLRRRDMPIPTDCLRYTSHHASHGHIAARYGPIQ